MPIKVSKDVIKKAENALVEFLKSGSEHIEIPDEKGILLVLKKTENMILLKNFKCEEGEAFLVMKT